MVIHSIWAAFNDFLLWRKKICLHVWCKLQYSYVHNMSPFFLLFGVVQGNEFNLTTIKMCMLSRHIYSRTRSKLVSRLNDPWTSSTVRCLFLCKFGFFHLDTEITKIFCQITINTTGFYYYKLFLFAADSRVLHSYRSILTTDEKVQIDLQ